MRTSLSLYFFLLSACCFLLSAGSAHAHRLVAGCHQLCPPAAPLPRHCAASWEHRSDKTPMCLLSSHLSSRSPKTNHHQCCAWLAVRMTAGCRFNPPCSFLLFSPSLLQYCIGSNQQQGRMRQPQRTHRTCSAIAASTRAWGLSQSLLCLETRALWGSEQWDWALWDLTLENCRPPTDLNQMPAYLSTDS